MVNASVYVNVIFQNNNNNNNYILLNIRMFHAVMDITHNSVVEILNKLITT